MTKESKLIEKIESKPPRSDITYSDFEKYLSINDFVLMRHEGTSHATFKHSSGDIITVAYHGKHVKVYSIKQAVQIVNSHKEGDV